MILLEGKAGRYVFNPNDPTSRIGTGGMGVVFKGFDVAAQKQVAIKVLYNNYAQNERILAKTILTSRIQVNHANLVRILDFIELDGRFHTVCEFLEGETLEKRIRRFQQDPIHLNEAMRIMNGTLDGLMALHSHKPVVIHRDINPSNIMLCKSGRVVIMDFGIARVLIGNQNSNSKVTIVNSGKTLGTYQYSPPEQIKGNYSEINQRSDIYSAALTFYEVLTGSPAFSHPNNMELMKMQLSSDLPPNNAIPKRLYKVLKKAAAKSQSERYESISDFSYELNNDTRTWWQKMFN
jgi:serine/threonine protein kinase